MYDNDGFFRLFVQNTTKEQAKLKYREHVNRFRDPSETHIVDEKYIDKEKYYGFDFHKFEEEVLN